MDRALTFSLAWGSAATLFRAFAAGLHRRSRSLVAFLDVRMDSLIAFWCAVLLILGLAKVAAAPLPIHGFAGFVHAMLPYLCVAVAPVAGYRIALASFPRDVLSAQPSLRLSIYGSWRRLDPVSARENPAFGPVGFMASLLVGLLLNVPFRTAEFILSAPAIGAGAPGWAEVLVAMMTLDVVVMNFFYMVCFVMALRAVPWFPRMMVFAWAADIVLQLAIAERVSATPGLPVQVGQALEHLLHGNIEKVLISAFVWLPYLILSERVNVTFRQRVRA